MASTNKTANLGLSSFVSTDKPQMSDYNADMLALDNATAVKFNRNAVINGGFDIWQRGTSFSNPAAGAFVADRWVLGFDGSGATRAISQQAFTPGAAPVAGYEAAYYLRWADTVAGSGESYKQISTKIEDVRTFAGQTATLSFWAKSNTSRTIALYCYQNFGAGGSGQVFTSLGNHNLTTGWQRFTITVAIPSISGKTIGTNSYLHIVFNAPLNTTFTLDLWGVQFEAGSVATSFRRNAPNLQAELAACQRYYFRMVCDSGPGMFCVGSGFSATIAGMLLKFPVTMRASPSSLDYNLMALSDTVAVTNITSMALNTAGKDAALIDCTVASGLTQYRPYRMQSQTTAAYIGLSAEI